MQRFRAHGRTPIPRELPTGGIADWRAAAPHLAQVDEHMARVMACAPAGWRAAIEKRFAYSLPPLMQVGQPVDMALHQPPEWAQAWDLLQAIADFEDEFGGAGRWNLSDEEIRDLAARLAEDVRRKEERMQRFGVALHERLDDVRKFVRRVGVYEDKPLDSEPAIARAMDAKWWRRRLRTHVARTVEAGAVRLGLVHAGRGGYISGDGLVRRRSQLARNAEALKSTLFRNEAGQVWHLDELAALGTANPLIRGGELMTRIRGAEDYADARAHVGLFLTLTLPSRFHAKRHGGGGRSQDNPKYAGATPREGQLWLRDKWQKTRAALQRRGVRMYGLRVAEPHHDATPHWHMLVWAEDEAGARAIEERIRHYWLSDAGDERGARDNRINVKRMLRGGAAGYVAKYIAKSVGHIALAEHLDVADGQQLTMDLGPFEPADAREPKADQQQGAAGHQRVDAWAATWGIRQFQTFGMPSVMVWRELRRVTPDQLELFQREGDRDTVRAHVACHRRGMLRADWRLFMEAMGGHALPRKRWLLRCAYRHVEAGQRNRYGEEIKVGRVVGLTPQRGRMCGRWLVSRRVAWAPIATVPGVKVEATERAALPPAWTRFNNCTARLTGEAYRQLVNAGEPWQPVHDSDWIEPPAPIDTPPADLDAPDSSFFGAYAAQLRALAAAGH
ncbi:replication endonuclease [uncultured Pseudacidovorax sp.]|uniref:replication endonuclease n=1 Tax=uncultured Pseudacidovorax sp. TaxID=679313 RepID=UPI0025E110E0|nr:replication endonuclease [uncultured Pseudacidovorax sp.]